jgi:hypothetical protein
MLADEHHRTPEVRVQQLRTGDEQLASEGLHGRIIARMDASVAR